MSFRRSGTAMRWASLAKAAPLVCVLALGGCNAAKSVFGGGTKPRLPGERVSVLTLEQKLEADPKLTDSEVRLPAPYVNDSWPEPGGYANHAMYHLQVGNDLKRAWRASIGTGAGSRTQIMAPPIIVDGRVFALDAECQVSALDAKTGKRLWRASLAPRHQDGAAGFGGGIASDSGKIFVTTGFGRVHALDAATGKKLWEKDLTVPFHTAPTANGGRVFATTQDNQLHVLAEDDGRELWSYQGIVEQSALLADVSPAVQGEVVIAPFSSGELYAFRVQNGSMAWNDSLTRTGLLNSMETINDIAGRPVIDRERVYAISHAGRLVSIDLRSGERVWTRDISGVQTPWVAGDYIYVVTSEAELLCVNALDGHIRWITPLQRFGNPKQKRDPIAWSGPVLAGNRLVLLSSTGQALSVSPYTGEIMSKMKIDDGTYVPPVVADGTLYILTQNAELTALR
jgi:outer membrane protein assembly factor BamB